MNDSSFQIFSPLKYSPIQVGNAKLSCHANRYYNLTVNNIGWMGYDSLTGWQSSEFIIELSHAAGICITTGLGLGIIQSLLLVNPNVSKVIVYEKNQDVINLFLKTVEYNNFDISNLEIRNEEANHIEGTNSDCVFLDHYEHESTEKIISSVKKISENNNTALLWYWPAAYHYIEYCESKRKSLNIDSYESWKTCTGIRFLPKVLENLDFEKLSFLKQKYLNDATGKINRNLIEFQKRNKLLEKFGKK